MINPLRTGPASTRVRGWLEHDRGRFELSHAGPSFVIGREELPESERAVLVVSVEGREDRRPVRVPAATPAGQRCPIEPAADAAEVAA